MILDKMGGGIDEGKLRLAVEEVIDENRKVVGEVKTGKSKAINFLVGQVMKKTSGRADPQFVERILKETIVK